MLVSIILSISWVILILFIWFKTDAFEKYSSLFRVKKLFKVDKFLEYKKINPVAEYIPYLRINYKNFFVSLVTCTPCLNFWLVLLITLINKILFLYPVVYLLSYIIYKLLNKYVF